MAGDKAKAAAGRKSKDKWKMKEWYNVHAPRMFNETVIGETPAADPEFLIGRQSEVTVQDLTGDFSKMHIKLRFKIVGYDGHEAKTELIGHDLTSDYVRRLTRRKKTKTDHVVDVKTADGFVLRLKTMSIADRRIQASQEEGMRAAIAAYLTSYAAENKLADIIKAIISGDMAKDTAKACHAIIPIKRIEIRKSEVLVRGEGEPESIIEAEAPAKEEEPAEEVVEAPAEAPAEEEKTE
ncbi:MAG: 30S ribosomal protein S3ae [Candidatus Methanomethylophilus sp.]|jgi:small subunit ribosomal protein S3Ae|nr:ribosomal protein S3Ae Rps3ae [methanogenic archaeon ISO4-H5]MBO5519223.1 30S ribosomal protein S3ae [Methanomethylophilus sp.]MBO5600541.1 30S ribosomal protein S3ae [Methanomethylophilus sp.]MEE3363608.1 30S ribosomal protein S3ae [Methanomethylophilus sp.]MEE3478116.1 30S ribosomal protein S3ae [Methanomethylophilus sp.]